MTTAKNQLQKLNQKLNSAVDFPASTEKATFYASLYSF